MLARLHTATRRLFTGSFISLLGISPTRRSTYSSLGHATLAHMTSLTKRRAPTNNRSFTMLSRTPNPACKRSRALCLKKSVNVCKGSAICGQERISTETSKSVIGVFGCPNWTKRARKMNVLAAQKTHDEQWNEVSQRLYAKKVDDHETLTAYSDQRLTPNSKKSRRKSTHRTAGLAPEFEERLRIVEERILGSSTLNGQRQASIRQTVKANTVSGQVRH